MRSGGSLRATVVLLLLLGLAAWALRLWQPTLICGDSGLGWLCGADAGATGDGNSTTRANADVSSSNRSTDEESEVSRGSVTEASALPWPIADAPRTWSNFRPGAYDIAAVATKAPEADAGGSKTQAHPFPWPVADAPIKWTNFREGAYSIAAVSEPQSSSTGGSKTQAHPFPWPIADAPVKWSNFRPGAYDVAEKAKKKEAREAKSKTVPHPFPWPVAEKPRKWTNFRQPEKRKKVAVKSSASKTLPHPFPWPIADKPRKWTNFRAQPVAQPKVEIARSPSVPYADGFVAYAPRGARNALELLVLRVKKGAEPAPEPKKASACGDELNRVARSGTILFETASARLTDSSYETLDELARVAKTCDSVKIVVEGHTDDRGSASFNQGLSERRAQAVAAYLQGAGIPGDSLSAVGYGESRPAVPNTSSANLRKNRRIEFSVSGT